MKILIWSLLLVVAGCTTSYGGITSSKPAGDGQRLAQFSSFEVETKELPVFLGPVIVSNFNVAMAERGYQPVSSQGDVVVKISYEQDDLPVQPGMMEVRFVARIQVDVLTVDPRELIWSGSIERLHTVDAGEYMHVGNASVSFLQAFRDLVSDVPVQGAIE